MVLASACGSEPSAGPEPSTPEQAVPDAPTAAVAGDPLLARARGSIRDGVVAASIVGEIQASEAPAHARAKRLLAAMATPVADEPEPEPASDGPSLQAPSLPTAEGETPSVPASESGSNAGSNAGSNSNRGSTAKTPIPSASADPPPKASSRASVSSLKLRKAKGGATLELRGTGKLVVGTANQLSSGVVHLVVDKAKASGSVASARPSMGGVKVTGVRVGQGTLQITLQLEPGWSLGAIKPFGGGTRVHFHQN